MAAMISGDDEPINPQEFVVKAKRERDSETPFTKGKKKKAPAQQRTEYFHQLKAELETLRPGFSIDWDTTSDAMLAQIVQIERDKGRNHYSKDAAPPAAAVSQPQMDMNDKILSGMAAILKEMKSLNRRVTKLEKTK